LQAALDRLVTVGDAAHREQLRLPSRRREFLAQQARRVLLDHDARLEIQPGGKSKILVRVPRVTIGATMLAAAIRVDARAEGNVRAVVVSDDGRGSIAQEQRPHRRIVRRIPIGIALQRDFLKATGRIGDRTPAARR
jgi:hypothetical protein